MSELKRYLSRPHPSIIELAAPLTVGYKQRVTMVAEAIHWAMEWLGSGSNHMLAGNLVILEELINTDSVHNNSSSMSKVTRSSISYVSCLIQRLHQCTKGEQGCPESCEVLIPPAAADVKPKYIQANSPIDMVIKSALITIAIAVADSSKAMLDDSSNSVEDDDNVYISEWYAGLFATTEVRQDSSLGDVNNADSFVWMYLFGSNFVLVFNTMNICTKAGCGKVIKLFVNLLFTEDHWVGFDPTIKHLHDLDCWEIIVSGTAAMDSTASMGNSSGNDGPSGSSGRTFYSNHMVVKVANGSIDKDVHDEVTHLCKITQTLEHYPRLVGTYLVLITGNQIELQSCSDNTFTVDMMHSVLGDLYDDVGVSQKIQKLPLQAHKCIAMSSIGLPLNDLKTIKELIIDCADTMCTHHAIANVGHRFP
ncbi:hypothetical protein LPJ66_001592 [Kickxella alabastrina]|uniref:Uncharacterized protein n=1 Tax=Kickxella alabastrina TaxID=61397 RepID=A0ACC1IST8_9FUNG|nr:hypothetical protein LPJ66_001592 [Kickxella alabastrina]